MTSLDQAQAENKFQSVTTTQDSIQSVALWVMHHKTHHEKVVGIWFKVLKKSKIEHRLTLMYLCNDIVQNCKRKHAIIYKDAFKEVLKDASLLLRDASVKGSITRIYTIWKERGVYDEEFIQELIDIVENSNVQPTISSKLLADFQPVTLMEKVITLNRYESELENRRRQLVNLRLDASSLEAIRQLKDKEHGQDFCREFEAACSKMDDYVKSLEKEIVDRHELIELLEQSELYYDAQYGEVKIVANAYKAFNSKVNALKKQLLEKMSSLPASVTPPYSPPGDIPSPDVTPPPVEEITSPPRSLQDSSKPAFMSTTQAPAPSASSAAVRSYFVNAAAPPMNPPPPVPPGLAPEPPTPPTPLPPPPDSYPVYRASPRPTPVELPPYLQNSISSSGPPPLPPDPVYPKAPSQKTGDKLETVDMDMSDDENAPGRNQDDFSPKSDLDAPQASPIIDSRSMGGNSLPGIAQGASSSFFGKSLDDIGELARSSITMRDNEDEGGSTPVMDEDQSATQSSSRDTHHSSSSREHDRERERRRERTSSGIHYDERSSRHSSRGYERGSSRDYDDRGHRRNSREDPGERSSKKSNGSNSGSSRETSKPNPIDFLTSLINAKPTTTSESSLGTTSPFLANLGVFSSSSTAEVTTSVTAVSTPSNASDGSWANWKANEATASTNTTPAFPPPPAPMFPMPSGPPGGHFPGAPGTFRGPPPGFPIASEGAPQPPMPINGAVPPNLGAPCTNAPRPPFVPHSTQQCSNSNNYPLGPPPFIPALSIPNSSYQPPAGGQNTSPQGFPSAGGNVAGEFGTPPTPPGFPPGIGGFPAPPRFPPQPMASGPPPFNRFPEPGTPQTHTRPMPPNLLGRNDDERNSKTAFGTQSSQTNQQPWSQADRFTSPSHHKPANLTTIQTVNYNEHPDNTGNARNMGYSQQKSSPEARRMDGQPPRFPNPFSANNQMPASNMPRNPGAPTQNRPHRFMSENAPVPSSDSGGMGAGEGQMEFIDKLRRKSNMVGSEAPRIPYERQNSSNLRTLTEVAMAKSGANNGESENFGIGSFLSNMRREVEQGNFEENDDLDEERSSPVEGGRWQGQRDNFYQSGSHGGRPPPRFNHPRPDFRPQAPGEFRPRSQVEFRPRGGSGGGGGGGGGGFSGPQHQFRPQGGPPPRFNRFPGNRGPPRQGIGNYGPTGSTS